MTSASRWPLWLGAMLGLVGVAAGAFGAHGLQSRVEPRDLEIWRTAAHYQQIHAVVLASIGLLGGASSRPRRIAAVLFVVGIAIFSGTLYAMVLGGPRMLGAITPFGGTALMAGWGALVVEGLRRPRDGSSV